jgi:two-component system, chemotaxis family, protein-glutamate methylesterase/glutaminase
VALTVTLGPVAGKARAKPESKAAETGRPVRLVVCDDSIFMRIAIKAMCSANPQITIVGEAKSGAEAIELVRTRHPDVVTMNIAMPGMDGVSATELIVRDHEVPVIILSGLTERGSDLADRALRAGAVDVLWKSSSLMDIDIGGITQAIVEKILFWGARPSHAGPYREGAEPAASDAYDLVVMSLGAGGPHAVRHVLGRVTPESAPVVIIANIPIACLPGFVRYIQRITNRPAAEVAEKTSLRRGTIFVLAASSRMALREDDGTLVFRQYLSGADENASAFSLVHGSVAETTRKALVVLLSGTPIEPLGFKAIARRGHAVFVQCVDSCVDAQGCMKALSEIDGARELSPHAIRRLLGFS